jgi:hypothetical protein
VRLRQPRHVERLAQERCVIERRQGGIPRTRHAHGSGFSSSQDTALRVPMQRVD